MPSPITVPGSVNRKRVEASNRRQPGIVLLSTMYPRQNPRTDNIVAAMAAYRPLRIALSPARLIASLRAEGVEPRQRTPARGAITRTVARVTVARKTGFLLLPKGILAAPAPDPNRNE